MGLLPANQRDQIKVFVGIVAFGLAGYYYTYPYAAQAEQLGELQAHVEKLETANTRARLEVTRGSAATLRQQAARARAGLEVMRRLVPTEHEVPALLEEVSTAARRAGLELGGVSPEPVFQGDQFDTYRYKITLGGGYHALAAFLANVGSLPRIVAPVQFGLVMATGNGPKSTVRVSKNAAPLTATLTIQTYVARSAGAPTPAGAAAPVHAGAATAGITTGTARTSAGETQP